MTDSGSGFVMRAAVNGLHDVVVAVVAVTSTEPDSPAIPSEQAGVVKAQASSVTAQSIDSLEVEVALVLILTVEAEEAVRE